MARRVIGGALCGIAIGLLYTMMTVYLNSAAQFILKEAAGNSLWRMFLFSVLTTAGVLLTEILLPAPGRKNG